MRLVFLFLLLFITACGEAEDTKAPLTLKPVSFSALPGWEDDGLEAALPALIRSCNRILEARPDKRFGPLEEAGTYKDWQDICTDLAFLEDFSSDNLRRFFESRFTPYQLRAGKKAEGLFTGYYEASLDGSLARSDIYTVPLHRRPDDLVMVQLGEFRDDLKGRRIAGRVVDGSLKPYEDRAAIVSGNWPHNDEVLVWVDDPVDAFFVQIQGSGIVALDDGSDMRIGYAGQNGHPYYAIGRALIKRGHLEKEDVSMQSIADWLRAHPGEAEEIMNTNQSYVFFTHLPGKGPLGGEGVALTPGRSLAVDRSLLPYGLPMWVDIEEPVKGYGRLRRLMLAQDTGGAIRGPVRGDVFWGHGEEAERLAGPMKSDGRYWALLPKGQ